MGLGKGLGLGITHPPTPTSTLALDPKSRVWESLRSTDETGVRGSPGSSGEVQGGPHSLLRGTPTVRSMWEEGASWIESRVRWTGGQGVGTLTSDQKESRPARRETRRGGKTRKSRYDERTTVTGVSGVLEESSSTFSRTLGLLLFIICFPSCVLKSHDSSQCI